MDKDLPEWLTEQFLSECVRSKERYQGAIVTRFTAEGAVPPGNNYGSYILRVRASVRTSVDQDLSLIVKCPLTSGAIKALSEDTIYESEPVFYHEFLPLGLQLLNRPFTPEYFQSPIKKVVVLEDLKEKGFVMAEKTDLLNFEHCRLYVTAAADFHAMSFAVRENNPDLIRRLGKEKIFSNDLEAGMVKANKNMTRYCLELLVKYSSEFLQNDRIPKILKNSSTTIWDLLVSAMKPNDTFNTFNQGDPWLTNMMFLRDENGKAYDIKLLDFQCLRYASPITDLVFFIWSSANYDVLKNKQDTLYEIYLDRFNSNLRQMKIHKELSMKTVKEHIAICSPFMIWLVGLGRPMVIKSSFTDMDTLYVKSMGDFSTESNPYDVLYTESFCKDHLPVLLDLLDRAGAFSYLESQLK